MANRESKVVPSNTLSKSGCHGMDMVNEARMAKNEAFESTSRAGQKAEALVLGSGVGIGGVIYSPTSPGGLPQNRYAAQQEPGTYPQLSPPPYERSY